MKSIFRNILVIFLSSFLYSNAYCQSEDNYTINYSNVSALEYIKFVSQICDVNFIYNEAELNFPISVVSEEPITPENVMGTLIQLLRIHNLTLLEQDNNLMIHRADGVKQIATVVANEKQMDPSSSLITRIFSIKNRNVDSIATIVRAMISSQALLEVLAENNQIIITDATTSIEKISTLIENLDSPISPLMIENYSPKENEASYLISLTSKILAPLIKGHPFISVPQETTNTIYIVSTPQLIEKAISVLTSLDIKQTVGSKTKLLKPENIFIYKPINQSEYTVEKALENLKKSLQGQGYSEKGLIETIDSMKWIKQTGSFLFSGDTASIAKVKEILATIDVPSAETQQLANNTFFIYKPTHRAIKDVRSAILEIGKNLDKNKDYVNQNVIKTINSAQIISSTNSIVFTGSPSTFKQVQDLLATIDIASKGSEAKTFYLYNITSATPDQIEKSLAQMGKYLDKSNVDDKYLIEAIKSVKYIPDSNSLIFSGASSALDRLKQVIPSFDQKNLDALSHQGSFFIYKLKNASPDEIESSLKEVSSYLNSSNTSDKYLIDAIKSMEYIKGTNSIIFSGRKDSLSRLETMLPSFDIIGTKQINNKYFVYKPKNIPGSDLEKKVLAIANNLESAKLIDPSLLTTIKTMKWESSSNSITFTGSQEGIQKLEQLLAKTDVPPSAKQKKSSFLYHLNYVSKSALDDYLKQIAVNLKKTGDGSTEELSLIQTLNDRQWVSDSKSYMFYGSDASIQEIKNFLSKYDLSKESKQSSYFLYKLKNTQGNILEDDLENFVKNLKSSGEAKKHLPLIDLIDNLKWIKETNSLMLTGSPAAIEEAKKLIDEYDIKRETSAAVDTGQFLVYKPKFQSAQEIETHLKDTAKNLSKANLTDRDLLNTVNQMRYVPSTNSLVFTGSEQSLTKVSDLLLTIDIPTDKTKRIQKVGQTTFILYKLKNASGPHVITSLKGVSKDLASLSKASAADKSFIETLNGVKYVKETNSLLFTGPEQALERVNDLVQKFDVPELAKKTAAPHKEDYFIYKPKHLSGQEVEENLRAFGANLQTTGISDPDLFDTIDTLKWMPSTKSLIVTGTPTALGRVKELLATFDVPGMGLDQAADTSIQQIDNMSFLVYKLQYHKGDQIQHALKKIATDLLATKSNINRDLLNAISSIQLIEATNSLLCSAPPETLTRLKELIKNLDVPLKQVFIEVLVIETTYTNALQFGLNWGGNLQWKNQAVGTVQNLDATNGPNAMFKNLESFNTTTTPAGGDIPFGPGFDLGVLGDIIFHKGKSFLSMGSLLSALQTDADSSIVTTPKIITQDSKTSTIFIGQNVPYVGSFVSQDGTNTVQTQNLEYRDIGINLTLTPILGNTDIITLDVLLSRTTATTDSQGNIVTTTGSVQGITTSKTTMNTTVHIPNKNFLILSGNVENNRLRNKAGVPCLGGLPWIGAAFSENNRTDNNTNIVIFIRPHIINSFKDMKHVTETQEDLFRDQSGSFELENDFEEAMELIKTLDDE